MKRIHLFEFEDFSWFPDWIRDSLTRLIIVMHKLVKTEEELTVLLHDVLENTNTTKIVDLCSGGGGPMLGVFNRLKEKHNINELELVLTDLYPNLKAANIINANSAKISYKTEPVDVTNVNFPIKGLRTMICSFHHMNPKQARKILESAYASKSPICIFEMSDNSAPIFLWWIALPINFIICLLITPFTKGLTLLQLLFTYIIPIIPLFFAWDGAVSNARTYTLNDLDELLVGLNSDNYVWKKGIIKGRGYKLYLTGMPK